MAQTTSEAPRFASPATNTPSLLVIKFSSEKISYIGCAFFSNFLTCSDVKGFSPTRTFNSTPSPSSNPSNSGPKNPNARKTKSVDTLNSDPGTRCIVIRPGAEFSFASHFHSTQTACIALTRPDSSLIIFSVKIFALQSGFASLCTGVGRGTISTSSN